MRICFAVYPVSYPLCSFRLSGDGEYESKSNYLPRPFRREFLVIQIK